MNNREFGVCKKMNLKVGYRAAMPVQGNPQNTTTNNSSNDVPEQGLVSLTSIYDKGFNYELLKFNALKPKNIAFKGILDGDYWYNEANSPLKKFMYVTCGDGNHTWHDKYVDDKAYYAGHKKWTVAHPADLMKRSIQDSIMSVQNIACPNGKIPDYIPSPDYGTTWGRRANYFEINPRAIAVYSNSRIKEGILQSMKLLPAIPASKDGIAHCVILSQLFPQLGDDGYADRDNGLYAFDLNSYDNYGISKNLTSEWLERDGQKISPREQVKAFNDLAHLRGLKTGIRLPLSEGQIRLDGNEFNWDSQRDRDKFIQACCYAVSLGFDAFYLDSGKHVGGYDMGNYHGCGKVPSYEQMQEITYKVRTNTGRDDIAFIAEKANGFDSEHFTNLGFNAGTDWSNPDSGESVYYEAKNQDWNHSYAAGPDVSNDNWNSGLSWNDRLGRVNNALKSYSDVDKLPVFFQMDDLFPIKAGTHDLMMRSTYLGSYGDAESHWNNLFVGDEANRYIGRLNEIFADVAKN